MMTIAGTIALVALIVLGILVLRVKSDPMENRSVRKFLAEEKGSAPPAPASPRPDCTPPPRPADLARAAARTDEAELQC